jgi:hypothetical protein
MINVNNCSGQLGNRLMRLNNALQLSEKHKKPVKLQRKDEVTKDLFKYFNFNLENYPKNGNNINLGPPDLGKHFFKNLYDPKSLISIKPTFQYKFNNNKTNIAIHIRYYPIKAHNYLNNEEMLFEYYKKAIDHCLKTFNNCHFIIFGAISRNQFRWDRDISYLTSYVTKFKFYPKLVNYLKENNISFDYSITIKNSKEYYMKDFLQMCDCDVIISSHSTFCICAGYLQKQKKIIHSQKMMNYFLNLKDIFWTDLNKGGNKYYNIYKLI